MDRTPSEWQPRRLVQKWQTIVIHHSATRQGGANSFDKTHRSKGWDELGYHFVIGNGSHTPDGHVEVGSRWHKQKHGAHCKTPDNFYNEHGIGICLVGDFTRSRPTPRQMESLEKLTKFLARHCHISSGKMTTHKAVTRKTACPGNFPIRQLRQTLARNGISSEPAIPAEPREAFARLNTRAKGHNHTVH